MPSAPPILQLSRRAPRYAPSAKGRLYGTARWQRYRLQQLRKEPLCAFCLKEGRSVPARIADHVEPHRGNEDRFWNGALQSLCKNCHDSIKQSMEKSGRPKVRIAPDGWPAT